MPDTPDLTPPPPEPMPEGPKARIRQQLSDAAQDAPARSVQRWLAPGLAAAAVLTVVGGAFVAASSDDNGGGGSLRPAEAETSTTAPGTPTPTTVTAETVTPTTGPGSVSPRPHTPTVTRAPEGTAVTTLTKAPPTATTAPVVKPPTTAVPTPGQPPTEPAPSTVGPGDPGVPTGPPPATSCAQEIAHAAEPSLRGAVVTAERDYGPGTTYLYETKAAWVVCDDLTATDGGAPTLLSFHDKARRYEPYAVTTAVSENLITNSDGSWVYDQFVAGGRDFDGGQAITYVFPDGHVEDAVVGRNGLWSMVYLATDGVFMDPNTNETLLDPIEVRVRYTSGDIHTFTLRWGIDTCAQLNHGC